MWGQNVLPTSVNSSRQLILLGLNQVLQLVNEGGPRALSKPYPSVHCTVSALIGIGRIPPWKASMCLLRALGRPRALSKPYPSLHCTVSALIGIGRIPPRW